MIRVRVTQHDTIHVIIFFTFFSVSRIRLIIFSITVIFRCTWMGISNFFKKTPPDRSRTTPRLHQDGDETFVLSSHAYTHPPSNASDAEGCRRYPRPRFFSVSVGGLLKVFLAVIMGRPFKQYLGGSKIYSCSNCRSHAADHDEIVSKAFQVAQANSQLYIFLREFASWKQVTFLVSDNEF